MANLTSEQVAIFDRQDRVHEKVSLAAAVLLLQQGTGQSLEQGKILRGGSGDVSEEYDASGDGKILVGDGTDIASVAVSGEASLDNAGVVTLDLSGHTAGKLSVQQASSGGASNGSIVKETKAAGETYTGSQAGLMIKEYDADNSVVHTEDELCGLYINLKQLSAISGGGKSALISAHNYGSGGDYQVLDFGLRLFGDIVDAIEITGGTVTSAIKLDTCSALTNVLKLADGVGCAVGTTMVKDPETDQEAGFITIDVDGTSYQIPFYATA